jgi:hypothetical protein
VDVQPAVALLGAGGDLIKRYGLAHPTRPDEQERAGGHPILGDALDRLVDVGEQVIAKRLQAITAITSGYKRI